MKDTYLTTDELAQRIKYNPRTIRTGGPLDKIQAVDTGADLQFGDRVDKWHFKAKEVFRIVPVRFQNVRINAFTLHNCLDATGIL